MAVDPDKNTQLQNAPPFLVLGPMGSGITTALSAYGQFGYMTVAGIGQADLAAMFPSLLGSERPVAVSLQLAPDDDAHAALELLAQLKQNYPALRVLYLDATEETLVQRFSESQKRHPYEKEGLLQAIRDEKAKFQVLREVKDYAIETGGTTPRELFLKIAKVLGVPQDNAEFTVYITTFGFKYGAPQDAELMFDMRFMTNPFYDETLRPMSGLDQPVKDYIFGMEHSRRFFEKWSELVGDMLPHYQEQGKTRLTVAVGCTGGKHRSVCMGEALAGYLRDRFPGYTIVMTHREMLRWEKSPQRSPGDMSTHA